MKILSLSLFVLILAVTPVLLLQTLVMPELNELQYTYTHLHELAAKAVE